MPEIFHEVEFWIAVAFVLTIIVIWKPAGKAIIGTLDARAERIRGQIEEARRLREEAEATLAEYQRRQRDAMAEAAEITSRARIDAERIGAQAAADLEAALKGREQAAMDRIIQAEAKALTEVRQVAVDVAIAATRTILVEVLDQQRGAALIDEAIQDLPRRLN